MQELFKCSSAVKEKRSALTQLERSEVLSSFTSAVNCPPSLARVSEASSGGHLCKYDKNEQVTPPSKKAERKSSLTPHTSYVTLLPRAQSSALTQHGCSEPTATNTLTVVYLFVFVLVYIWIFLYQAKCLLLIRTKRSTTTCDERSDVCNSLRWLCNLADCFRFLLEPKASLVSPCCLFIVVEIRI